MIKASFMVVYTPLLIYKPAKSSHQVMRPPHQTIQTKGVGGERLAKGGTRGIFRGVARSQVSRINKKYGRLIDNKRGLCQFVEKDFSHSGTSSIVHINNWIVCSCHLHGTLHTHTQTHTHTWQNRDHFRTESLETTTSLEKQYISDPKEVVLDPIK